MTNPDRVAFALFGKDIYWYGILMAVGIIIAIFLTLKEGKRKKFTEDNILDMCLVIIPCGIVGARLFYVLFELEFYLSNPIKMLYVWEGGLAIYGAVIGGLVGLFFYARHKKARFLKLCDCLAPGLVLAQAIGRWGNFFNQEAYGRPITNPNLMWFPFAVRIDGVHYFDGQICTNPYHMATFFYESMWCLLIFVFLWLRRKKFKHDGDVLLTYTLLYGIERMFVEGLRGDSLWLIAPDTFALFSGGIRVSQMISFVAVAVVAVFFLVRRSREKKLGRLIWPAPEATEEAAQEATDAIAEEPKDAVAKEDVGEAPDKLESIKEAKENSGAIADEFKDVEEKDEANKVPDVAEIWAEAEKASDAAEKRER